MREQDEIRKLKKENHDLRRRIAALEKSAAAETVQQPESADVYKANNYFSYLYSCFKEKSFYSSAMKFYGYFRGSMWVTRVLRYGLLAYQYLQAGAFVLLYTAFFIMFIPIMLSTVLLTLIVTLILRKRNADKLMSETLSDVQFVIPRTKEEFAKINITEIAAAHPGSSILIITPHFFKKTGVSGKNAMFVCFRKESENIYIVRKYFFFYLRKRMRKNTTFALHEIILGE